MFSANAKCPNCNNELDAGGSATTIPTNKNAEPYQSSGNNVLCIYCSAELALVSRKVWLGRIGTYLIFLPVGIMLVFPQIISEERWLLILLLVPSLAIMYLSIKTPTYEVRSKTNSERNNSSPSHREPCKPPSQGKKAMKMLSPYLWPIFGFTALFVVLAKETFKYTLPMHWIIALVVGALSAGFVLTLKRLLLLAEKRYSKRVLDWYGTFSKRSMNPITISIIAVITISAMLLLIAASICLTQILKLGWFFLRV